MGYLVYDYYCPHCHATEERMVRQAQADTQYCDQCPPGTKLRRLLAAPPTTFRFADTKLKR